MVDEKTVRRAQRGDPAALDRVVSDLAPYVGRICGAIALDRADDAMQEAMISVMGNLHQLREPRALRGWARRIAVREAVRAAGGGREIAVAPEDLPAEIGAVDGQTAVDVRAVLEDLDPAMRAVLVLRHLGDLREDEMAEVLDVAPGTVKSRLSRARRAFRDRWTA